MIPKLQNTETGIMISILQMSQPRNRDAEWLGNLTLKHTAGSSSINSVIQESPAKQWAETTSAFELPAHGLGELKVA